MTPNLMTATVRLEAPLDNKEEQPPPIENTDDPSPRSAVTLRKNSVFARARMYGRRTMEWLNYHHLLYFWAVARYGSVVRASAELRLAQPTISGQVRRLEEVLGEKLFERVGRRLALTHVGRTGLSSTEELT
jgi:hypothetical protein